MDLKDLLTKWGMLVDQEKTIKETKDMIKEHVAKIMHRRKINELVSEDSNEENWEMKYQQTTRNSTNLELLAEIISDEDFEKVVTKNTSTSLVIRKTKKSNKTKDVINTPPVEITSDKLEIPTGEIK